MPCLSQNVCPCVHCPKAWGSTVLSTLKHCGTPPTNSAPNNKFKHNALPIINYYILSESLPPATPSLVLCALPFISLPQHWYQLKIRWFHKNHPLSSDCRKLVRINYASLQCDHFGHNVGHVKSCWLWPRTPLASVRCCIPLCQPSSSPSYSPALIKYLQLSSDLVLIPTHPPMKKSDFTHLCKILGSKGAFVVQNFCFERRQGAFQKSGYFKFFLSPPLR